MHAGAQAGAGGARGYPRCSLRLYAPRIFTYGKRWGSSLSPFVQCNVHNFVTPQSLYCCIFIAERRVDSIKHRGYEIFVEVRAVGAKWAPLVRIATLFADRTFPLAMLSNRVFDTAAEAFAFGFVEGKQRIDTGIH